MSHGLRTPPDAETSRAQPAIPAQLWYFLLLALAAILAASAWLWLWSNPWNRPATVYALLYAGSALSADGASNRQDATREEVYRHTQASLLRTRVVLDRALGKLAEQGLAVVRMQTHPLDWLERELRVETSSQTKTIRVSMSGDHPEELAQIVNAVVRAYFDEFVRSENREHQERLARYERLVQENTDGVTRELTELQSVCRQLQGPARGSRLQLALPMDRATETQQEWETVTAQLAKAQLQLDTARKQRDSQSNKVPEPSIDAELGRDLEAVQWRAQIARLNRTIAGYAENARADAGAAPIVRGALKGYRADLADAQEKLDRRRDEIRTRLSKQLQQTLEQNSKEAIPRLEAQIAQLTEQENLLRQRLGDQLKESEARSRSWVDVEFRIKEIERKLEAARRFTRELRLVQAEVQNAPRVQLVLEAAWPQP